MLSFIAALYNEEAEIGDLINHVHPYVDSMYFADDGSKDQTLPIIAGGRNAMGFPIDYASLRHTGLPETVKSKALGLVPNGSWVLMLDADERFAPGVLDEIKEWLETPEAEDVTHVYFTQVEIIDGVPVRHFQKSKLFRKAAVSFSEGIHEDDQFTGPGIYKEDWIVLHRKSSDKQKMREKEYLETYKKLLLDGKIDTGRYHWLRNLHHYEKGTTDVPSS